MKGEYTAEQWQWVWERFCEGYSLKELGGFLYLHHETIRRRFQKMGLRPEAREELEPLAQRRREFCALQREGAA